jgi:hypothetical protein
VQRVSECIRIWLPCEVAAGEDEMPLASNPKFDMARVL